MDTKAIATGRRRRLALEALEFERDRESALRDQLEERVTEVEGPQIDEAAFARMEPEDVEVIRSIIGSPEPDAEDEWLALGTDFGTEDDADAQAEHAEELVRLEAEIADSKRRQQALDRYLEALGS